MNRIVWTSDRPGIVLDGMAWHRHMPMPTVRKARASQPWAEVHRERGTRNRARRSNDTGVAIAATRRRLAAMRDALTPDDPAEDARERDALAALRVRNEMAATRRRLAAARERIGMES